MRRRPSEAASALLALAPWTPKRKATSPAVSSGLAVLLRGMRRHAVPPVVAATLLDVMIRFRSRRRGQEEGVEGGARNHSVRQPLRFSSKPSRGSFASEARPRCLKSSSVRRLLVEVKQERHRMAVRLERGAGPAVRNPTS